jgi:hypothetical protein
LASDTNVSKYSYLPQKCIASHFEIVIGAQSSDHSVNSTRLP